MGLVRLIERILGLPLEAQIAIAILAAPVVALFVWALIAVLAEEARGSADFLDGVLGRFGFGDDTGSSCDATGADAGSCEDDGGLFDLFDGFGS